MISLNVTEADRAECRVAFETLAEAEELVLHLIDRARMGAEERRQLTGAVEHCMNDLLARIVSEHAWK